MNNENKILDALLESTGDAVIITDERNLIISVNTEFERLTDQLEKEVVGKSPDMLKAGSRTDILLAEITEKLLEGNEWQGEAGNDHILSVRPVFDSNGNRVNCLALLREKGKREGDSANIDPLTGLPDRTLFRDRIEQAVITGRRTGKSVAVLLITLDRLTLINQGFGHNFGDQILVEVALKLHKCIRESDTVARLQGDHFILVMPVATPDDIVIIAEKVLNSINEPTHIKGQVAVITASIGISVFPADGKDAEELMRHADSAMRYAKKGGGNDYQFFSHEMNVKAKKRLEMEESLRQALLKEEFVLYYQPKVNVETNRIGGMEALVRWISPERGMISPTEFIPIAEETGLIQDIGLWVLNEACRQNKAWQDKGLNPVRVSVNVSGRQFRDHHFVEKVAAVLEETRLGAGHLELELTESMLMDDVGEIVEKLGRLRDLGAFISIDDFGTGYSNLSYLHSFPITTLKIDRAFITDLETNPNIAEISRAIINLSKGLNLEVVAEGAETKEHVAFLRDHGCGMIQGFYYSKPLTPEEFEIALERGYL